MFRTISTFASTGGFSAYLWVSIVLTFALYRLARTRSLRYLALGAIVLQGIAMLTAGGRSPVVWTMLSLLMAVVLMRRLKYLVFATCVGVIVFLISLQLLGGVIEGRFGTLLNKELVLGRNTPLIMQMSAAMKAPPEGLGAGRLSTAALRYDPSIDFVVVENAFARVRYEAGLAGLILFCAAFFTLAFEVFSSSLRMNDSELRIMASCVTGYLLTCIAIFPLGTPLDMPPSNFFFWFLLGMLYAMRRVDYQDVQMASSAGDSCAAAVRAA
jgi:cell division protein FtsW (lipid II flippase)